jgi:glycosyltransferase involved in cell wall biosynthesis
MKKILHIADWANGGLATYLYSVINEQKKYYDLKLLASEEMSESRLTDDEQFVSFKGYNRSLIGLYRGFKQSREFLRHYKPDIVYIHSSFAGVFARLALLKLDFQPKVIYCAHGWAFLMHGSILKRFFYAQVEKWLSYMSDVIITISKKEYEAALKIGIPSIKLTLIYHGISKVCDTIDLDFKDAESFNSEYLHILFLGRYDYQKGFDWLLDFIHNHHFPNICWHIAGKNILANSLDIPGEVVNHGWIDHKDIGQLLLRCDALIMPSRWEGFGFSAIEAMKYSKPVLASYNGALPELIQNNYNGKLFHLNNYQEVQNIISNIDKNELKQLGQNAYNIFIQNYTEEKMLAKLSLILRKMEEK